MVELCFMDVLVVCKSLNGNYDIVLCSAAFHLGDYLLRESTYFLLGMTLFLKKIIKLLEIITYDILLIKTDSGNTENIMEILRISWKYNQYT